MTYSEIEKLCKKGKTGLIPGWKGYLKWDYALDQLYFVNGNYIINDIKDKIKDRTDLYYII